MRRHRWLAAASVAGVLCAVLLILTLAGPDDPGAYPAAAGSPYILPYASGTSHWCVQGNRGLFTHRGRFEHSYDFLMAVGTQVNAARAGVVVEVVEDRRGVGNFPGNRVVIEHADGTRAYYVHLRQNGAAVRVGQHVTQGQGIASSGSTGRSLYPHLHFHVERAGATIPVSFADVGRHRGVPRAGARYQALGR